MIEKDKGKVGPSRKTETERVDISKDVLTASAVCSVCGQIIHGLIGSSSLDNSLKICRKIALPVSNSDVEI